MGYVIDDIMMAAIPWLFGLGVPLFTVCCGIATVIVYRHERDPRYYGPKGNWVGWALITLFLAFPGTVFFVLLFE